MYNILRSFSVVLASNVVSFNYNSGLRMKESVLKIPSRYILIWFVYFGPLENVKDFKYLRGAVVRPLSCRAKVPGFKSRQNLICPPCSKRVPYRYQTVHDIVSLLVFERLTGCRTVYFPGI